MTAALNPAASHAQRNGTLDVEAFIERFPDIEAGLDWARFRRENWPITCSVITDRQQVLGFHSFFRHSLGRINGHFLHWMFLRQMPVGEVLKKFDRVPQKDRASIQYFAERFARSAKPIVVSVPTFALPGGGHYLMDFNHRVCGLILSNVDFVLEVCAVHGPISKSALKDATHCRPLRKTK